MAPRNIFVFVLFTLGACASPVESYCAAQAACNEQGNKSEVQCAADGQKLVDDVRKKPECETLADAYEQMLSCQGSLSCKELELSPSGSPCKKEMESYFGSFLNNAQCLFQ